MWPQVNSFATFYESHKARPTKLSNVLMKTWHLDLVDLKNLLSSLCRHQVRMSWLDEILLENFDLTNEEKSFWIFFECCKTAQEETISEQTAITSQSGNYHQSRSESFSRFGLKVSLVGMAFHWKLNFGLTSRFQT